MRDQVVEAWAEGKGELDDETVSKILSTLSKLFILLPKLPKHVSFTSGINFYYKISKGFKIMISNFCKFDKNADHRFH